MCVLGWWSEVGDYGWGIEVWKQGFYIWDGVYIFSVSEQFEEIGVGCGWDVQK